MIFARVFCLLLLISSLSLAAPCRKSEDQLSVTCTAEGFAKLIAAEIKTKADFAFCGVELRASDAKLKAAGERISTLEAAVVGESPPVAWIAAGSFVTGILIAVGIFKLSK